MFRPILVPHGITDLVDYPFKSIILYGTLTPIIAKLPWETKAGILLVASVYHLRNDVPVACALTSSCTPHGCTTLYLQNSTLLSSTFRATIVEP